MEVKKSLADLAQAGQKKYSDFRQNVEVSKLAKELRGKAKDLAGLQDDWNKALEGGNFNYWLSMPRNMLYGALSYLPGSVGEHFEHKKSGTDPFDKVEQKSKEYIGKVEEIIAALGVIARAKAEEAEQAKEVIEQAKKEKWDVKTLREYITQESGMTVGQDMEDALVFAVEKMTPEQVERKRDEMFSILENRAKIQEETVRLLGIITIQGAETYTKALEQYFGFNGISQQLQAYRDAAMQIATTEGLSLDTKDMVKDFVGKVTNLAETAIDTLPVLEKSMVASPEVLAELARVREGLEQKLGKVLSGKTELRPKVNTAPKVVV